MKKVLFISLLFATSCQRVELKTDDDVKKKTCEEIKTVFCSKASACVDEITYEQCVAELDAGSSCVLTQADKLQECKTGLLNMKCKQDLPTACYSLGE